MTRGIIKRAGFTLTEIMIVVVVIGVLVAIVIPNFAKSRATSQRNACIANIRAIDAAVQQWEADNNRPSTSTYSLTSTSILLYLRNSQLPLCPAGGTYKAPKNSQKAPVCSLSSSQGHSI